MRVAVVGCGTMGKSHIENLAAMPGVGLVAICDNNEIEVNKTAEQWQIRAYVSLDEMINMENPDVVSICLPTYLHKEYVLRVAAYGKHIICEKPIAPSIEDAVEMINTCKEKGVRLFVGHVVRFFPNYADIKAKVDAGVIGKVGVIHTKRIGSNPARARAWYKDRSGGVIIDLMIHDIDFLCSVMGEVTSVYALQTQSEQNDYALVTLRFAGGAIANLEAHWGYPGPFTTAVEFAGTEGVIRFNSEDALSLKIVKAASAEDNQPAAVAIPQSPAFHNPYYYELKHFLACIENDTESIVTATDALRALRIALAAAQSAQTGMKIDIH
jgi:UDP-N-acetylglucosamine 3-dehydrogenase